MGDVEDKLIIDWGGASTGDTVFSITDYVEENSKRIRSKYISFIHGLGETVSEGKRLVDHMEVKPGFSLWWMSLPAEKNYFKSPHIVDCLKLIALEEVLKAKQLDAIKVLRVGVEKVADSIRIICWDNKIQVSIECEGAKQSSIFQVKRLYQMLPHFVQGIIWLMRRVVSQWPLRRAKNQPSHPKSHNDVFICSYFDGVSYEHSRQGRFVSSYWTELPDLLLNLGKGANWLHMFITSKEISNTQTGVEVIERINKGSEGGDNHHFLESQLSFNVVIRAVGIWLRIITKPIKFKRIEQAILKNRQAVSLWPLLKEDWRKSIFGSTSIHNTLCMELFEAALRQFPPQKIGFYLHEGQGWERAFIHAWRKCGHGKLIAVAHTPSRFWIFADLIHPDNIADESLQAMPVPDLIAVNGPVGKEAFLEAGYSSNDLVSVEALRYLGLKRRELKVRKLEHHTSLSVRRLLVLGDITPAATRAMLQTLDSLPEEMLSKIKIVVKPHPNNPVQKSDYPDLPFTLIDVPLSDILNEVDIAYGASPTSANLDAFLVGVPIIVHQAKGQLNFSPLRGRSGIRFVSSAEDLGSALSTISKRSVIETEEYFWLDRGLPRWRELLGNS